MLLLITMITAIMKRKFCGLPNIKKTIRVEGIVEVICHLWFVKLIRQSISTYVVGSYIGISNEYLDRSCIPKKSDKESRISCLAFQMMLLEKETCFTWHGSSLLLAAFIWIVGYNQLLDICGRNGTGTKNLQSHGGFWT